MAISLPMQTTLGEEQQSLVGELTCPRIHMHFTPTSSSYLNLIERWLVEITRRAIRSGEFHSVDELITVIMGHVVACDEIPNRADLNQGRDGRSTKSVSEK